MCPGAHTRVSGGAGFHSGFTETLIRTGQDVHVGLTCVCQISDLSQDCHTRLCHEPDGRVHMGGIFTSMSLCARQRVLLLHVWRACEAHILHLCSLVLGANCDCHMTLGTDIASHTGVTRVSCDITAAVTASTPGC